jgi:hypothetical protein
MLGFAPISTVTVVSAKLCSSKIDPAGASNRCASTERGSGASITEQVRRACLRYEPRSPHTKEVAQGCLRALIAVALGGRPDPPPAASRLPDGCSPVLTDA